MKLARLHSLLPSSYRCVPVAFEYNDGDKKNARAAVLQSSYSEATVILREGYRRNSAIRARMVMPDSGVSDYGESVILFK
jgi:hypothetical protein